MKELLHHFGFINNRVLVGITGPAQLPIDVHGVVVGSPLRSAYRIRLPFVVDDPKKLSSPSNGMVLDIIDQLSKLGIDADMVELHASSAIFTYRALPRNQVEFLSQAPRYE